MGCVFKNPDKSECLKPATHHWGPVEMCCDHFDLFVDGLLDLKDAIQERRHTEIVEEYNRKCKRPSVLPGAPCDSEKKVL